MYCCEKGTVTAYHPVKTEHTAISPSGMHLSASIASLAHKKVSQIIQTETVLDVWKYDTLMGYRGRNAHQAQGAAITAFSSLPLQQCSAIPM